MNPFPRHRRRQAASPAGAGAAPNVLDPATLARLRQLDPDDRRGFVNQVLRTYEAALVRHLAALEEADAQADLRRAGEVAHTLKSSSASIGALSLAQCCTAVEQLARAGDVSALGAPLVTLRAEGTRVLASVRAILPN